jgi:hypothetical protein
MAYTTDPKTRAEFITSLRAMAEFLDRNPAVPVPARGADVLLSTDSYEDGGKAQVDNVARLLGATVVDDTAHDGHYVAGRMFGCLAYRVVSIPALSMAKHYADMSYSGCVTPDSNWG